MNSKVLIAALVTGVATFFLGWIIYGMALKGYMDANTSQAALALSKGEQMNYLGMAIHSLTLGALIAWALGKMGVSSAGAGWMPGAIILGLITLAMDMFMLSMYMWYLNKTVVIVDIIVSVVLGAILGAIAGAMLGMGSKKAATAVA